MCPGSQTRPFAGLSMQAMKFCIGSKLRWNVRCVVNIVTDMIIKKRSGNKEGSTRGDNLFLPLQRTGTFASYLSLIIIKHGLTPWVHHHNMLLPINLRFQFLFFNTSIFIFYIQGGTNL